MWGNDPESTSGAEIYFFARLINATIKRTACVVLTQVQDMAYH